MAQTSAKALQSSLGKLHISKDSKAAPSVKRAEPVDSWEDEADEESSNTETENTPPASSSVSYSSSYDSPAPPPPTPSSPTFGTSHTSTSSPFRTFPPYGLEGNPDSKSSSGASTPSRRARGDDDKRPEKTTAVASRLIAAGIGQKAPKRTKEQREYDQAMKVQEKKKRDTAKAEEERKKAEAEKARKDVWGD